MPVTRTPYAPPPDAPVPIVHLDDHLLVVDKPHGLLSVPGRGADKSDCLEARVRRTCPEALTVHRLDMETSGLVLFARSAQVQRALSRLFETRRIGKSYTALVEGCPTLEHGTIDAPIVADWPNRPRQIVSPDGKPARTDWTRIESSQTRSRLALKPVTGRTHQLRVHFASIGHPILGDTLYGSPSGLRMASRLALHADALAFSHPISGAQVVLASSAPF